MQAQKILFPTDFSRTDQEALKFATTLARDTGATLLIAHVEEPPRAYGAGELYYGIPDPNTESLRKMLHEVQPADPAVPCEHHLVSGDPPPGAIVRLAEEEGVDLIVMGTHGRTGLPRLLMGSVAEVVVPNTGS